MRRGNRVAAYLYKIFASRRRTHSHTHTLLHFLALHFGVGVLLLRFAFSPLFAFDFAHFFVVSCILLLFLQLRRILHKLPAKYFVVASFASFLRRLRCVAAANFLIFANFVRFLQFPITRRCCCCYLGAACIALPTPALLCFSALSLSVYAAVLSLLARALSLVALFGFCCCLRSLALSCCLALLRMRRIDCLCNVKTM